MLERDGLLFKEIIDSKSQCLLEHITSKANERGMAINAEKTGLMLISAATRPATVSHPSTMLLDFSALTY